MTGLDHIILGSDDLDRGIAWVEERTGVRAAFGGVHPGRGTRNALLALGPDRYLEIIAPDPAQSAPAWFAQILSMPEPKLIAWAMHTSDLQVLARTFQSAGIAIDGPHDGARARPGGGVLRWKLFRFRHDHGGLLPFFIEWSRDSIHPAVDAPTGCRLASFHLQSPDAARLSGIFQTVGAQISVEPHERPRILTRIVSPNGDVELTS